MATNIPMISDPFVLARFFKEVDQSALDGCWAWGGLISSNGYGRFSYKDKHRLSHRVSYQIFFGEIPDGFVVCHKCDVRNCVNPLHLWLGTQSDNLKDASEKGRMYRPDTNAEKNGNTSLSWVRVKKIRELSALGYQNYKLASLFLVSQSTIANIVKNQTWKEAA